MSNDGIQANIDLTRYVVVYRFIAVLHARETAGQGLSQL